MASSPAKLTLALAERLCAEAAAAADAIGFGATVAVVDAGGHLVAFRRDDRAGFVTVTVAQRKAWTAAAAGMPSEQWNAFAADPDVAPILHGTNIMAVAGGLPIALDGQMVGGLGVSGSNAAQDREAATRGLAAVIPS